MSRQGLPPNEFGFSLCRDSSGKLVPGPVAHGGPFSVDVPLTCPGTSHFEGLFHTHPGGAAFPSPTDIRNGQAVGAKFLCVQNDQHMQCFRLERSRS